MSEFVFDPGPRSAAPISGAAARFPIRRIYCVARNYAAHAAEMGGDASREPPFFFQKNPDDADFSGEFPYPTLSSDVHHEVELVLALHRGGADIAEAEATACVFGYAVGIDMTRRDLQAEAKAAGRPWMAAKAFARSAPMGPIRTAEAIGHPHSGAISLAVDGEPRQQGDLSEMIWKPAEIIARLSQLVVLAPGDLIMTGTPSGVGPIERGQTMQARIDGVGELSVGVV